MPTWMPEGDTIKSTDDEMRALAKYCSLMYDGGAKASPFPEGNYPKTGDDEQRLWVKVNALRN